MDNETTVVIKRVIEAEPKTIFEAFTNPDILEQWFYATSESATVEAEPTPGGSFQIEMHDQYTTYRQSGTYREIVPNEKIVFT